MNDDVGRFDGGGFARQTRAMAMMSNLERLIYMANQIARNFAAIGHDHAVAATADHIASFWDPRMKAQILDFLKSGDPGLEDAAAEAVRRLAADAQPASQTAATQFGGRADAG